jgi:hypothetical protein
MGNEDDVDLKRQLDELEHSLNPAERELWDALQNFIKAQTMAGVSRDRAYSMARNLLRRASDIRARKRRASFKVVEP